MRPTITAKVETHPKDPKAVNASFVVEGLVGGATLPWVVQNDLVEKRARFFKQEGYPPNNPKVRDELRALLQEVIDEHLLKGNLDLGFLNV